MLNLDEEKLNNINDANTSSDLAIGDEYRDHREGRSTHLNDGDTITLEPGGAVVIQTQEWIRFPKTRFGQILPKVKLLEDGISNTTSKIDPGYIVFLTITLFNLGKTTKNPKERR
ncbi:MAG: dCTP deaminase domain-containing protein [Bacillota bacterium]